MGWTFKPAGGHFDEVRKDWDNLNLARGNHLLLDSRFVGALLRHFGGPSVILGTNQDSRRLGMSLLVKTRQGIWETFQPSQAPLGLILFGYQDDSGEGLLELRRALPGFSLELSILQQDPNYTCFPPCQKAPEIEHMEYIRTPYLPVLGTYEEYWKSRGADLRLNLARRRRRLVEQKIALELKIHRGAANVKECIEEYGRLESKGWKGKNGTAVAEDNVQGRFYREIFETFCESNEGVIYQWRLDGKIAASDLCLERAGMMIVLKTAYDEGLNRFSPALMMRQEIIRDVYQSRTVRVVEFYGRVMEWHTKWTASFRTMYHVNCFRQPWVRKIRNFVSRLNGAS